MRTGRSVQRGGADHIPQRQVILSTTRSAIGSSTTTMSVVEPESASLMCVVSASGRPRERADQLAQSRRQVTSCTSRSRINSSTQWAPRPRKGVGGSRRDCRRRLRVHMEGRQLSGDVDLDAVARATPGFSGADLANLENEAAIVAVRDNREVITATDLGEARDRILLGRREAPNALLPEEKRAVAVHEAGHALVAALSPHADHVAKITILPAGASLGVTELLPTHQPRLYLRATSRIPSPFDWGAGQPSLSSWARSRAGRRTTSPAPPNWRPGWCESSG